jgi:hypothetical protein
VRAWQHTIGDASDAAGDSSVGPKQAALLFPHPDYHIIAAG